MESCSKTWWKLKIIYSLNKIILKKDISLKKGNTEHILKDIHPWSKSIYLYSPVIGYSCKLQVIKEAWHQAILSGQELHAGWVDFLLILKEGTCQSVLLDPKSKKIIHYF